MDSAQLRPSSPTSTSTIAHATSHLQHSTTPTQPTQSKRHSDAAASRQHRLLNNRNAKFPAKRLSLSNLSSRFSQLIHASDDPQAANIPRRNQENEVLDSNNHPHDGKRHTSSGSLSILDELSNPTVKKRQKRNGNIAIYQDTLERPLLERSPFSSPAVYQDISSQDCSPIGFDHVQDSLGSMRLREISSNERRGSLPTDSPLNGSVKSLKKRKSIQIKAGFDTQEYIEHLERELQAAKNEVFSPTTNKSLKDQLRNTRVENDRLKQDMVDLRDMFEAEVKRNIEHKVEMEVELKRKVRDLEEELEQKVLIIRDLELQHDEKRLDNNTIDALKAAIEKLEHDKIDLEDENRSVNKRNEVLSELLAMSPTKMQSFELRSPVREKRRTGRPMSMIIPKISASPSGRLNSHPASAVVSPSPSVGEPFFSPLKTRATSPQTENHGLGISRDHEIDVVGAAADLNEQVYMLTGGSSKLGSRRSTMQSQTSGNDTASVHSFDSMPADHSTQRLLPKRKPRRFMAGSTQLKPLLLPALTGDGMPLSSSSAASSPRIEALRNFSTESIDPTTYFLSRPEESPIDEPMLGLKDFPMHETTDKRSTETSVDYQTFADILAEHNDSLRAIPNDDQLNYPSSTKSPFVNTPVTNNQDDCGGRAATTEGIGLEVIERPIFCEEGEPEQVSAGTCTSEPLFSVSDQDLPSTTAFDLNALNDLTFPKPDYDAFPNQHSGVDDELIHAVPQPLFSIHNLSHQSRHWLDSHQSETQSQYIGDPGGVCYEADLDSSVLSPTAQIRSLWPHQDNRRDEKLPSPDIYGRKELPRRSALPSRSTSRNSNSLIQRLSTPNLLRSSNFGARPLAALTIRTIFGTISRCTSHVRDLKRDPLALARRVIANAWFSNWAKFGKLSWWVLGLFISTGLGGPKLREWQWADYDAEEIARQACRNNSDGAQLYGNPVPGLSSTPAHSELERRQPQSHPDDSSKQKVGWGKSILLWGKFSAAIMLAVGGAIVKGPGEMLKDEKVDTNCLKGHGTSCLEEPCSVDCCRSHGESCTYHNSDHGGKTRMCYDQHRSSNTLSSTVCHNPHAKFDQSAAPRSHLERSGHSDHHYIDTDIYDDADITLRAVSSTRPHVASIFQSTGMRYARSEKPLSTRIAEYNLSLSSNDTDHLHEDVLQWPPSPGLIYPEQGRVRQ